MVQKITKDEEFWLMKILAKKFFFFRKKFGSKSFVPKIILGPIKFWVLKNFGSTNLCWKKIMPKKMFSQNVLVKKMVQKTIESKTILGKKILGQ